MKNKKISKAQKVLEHLQKFGTITSWEAIENYGATRLSAIIYNLREKYIINSEKVSHIDKYGNQSTFSRYLYCGEKGVI